MRIRGTYLLLLCVFFAAQLVGLCEAACLLLEMDHHQIRNAAMAAGDASAAASAVAAHAGHEGTPPTETAPHEGHRRRTPDDAEATHSAARRGGDPERHCPACDGSAACSIDKTPLPLHASLTAGFVPPISLLRIEPTATDAPAIVAAVGDSLADPPEAEPPRA